MTNYNVKYLNVSVYVNRMASYYHDLNFKYFKVSVSVNRIARNYYDLKF